MPDQHQSLGSDRWARFTGDQQLMMIANEMHRATKALALEDARSVALCYERALRLTDLTVAVGAGLAFRRELLRWRDLIAALYLEATPDRLRHEAALKALLGFSPATWAQAPFLLPGASA